MKNNTSDETWKHAEHEAHSAQEHVERKSPEARGHARHRAHKAQGTRSTKYVRDLSQPGLRPVEHLSTQESNLADSRKL